MTTHPTLKPAIAFTTRTLDRFYPPAGEQPGLALCPAKLAHIRLSKGELSIHTGLNGHGKSLILNQFALEAIHQGERVAIASFEMAAPRNLQRLVRQATCQSVPDEATVIGCLEWLGDRLLIYDRLGKGDAKQMLETFHRAAGEGVGHFVIDSLAKLGLGEDDLNGQKSIVDRFQNFAQHDSVHVHLVCHSRKQQSESDAPGKMDVRGSATITDLADNGFSIWRNKAKELKIQELRGRGESVPYDLSQKPDALFSCFKHRDLGADAEGTYGLWFHPISMQFLNSPADSPFHYFTGGRP